MHLKEVINIDKEILNGTPVFKKTKVSVQTLFDYPEERSLEEFLKSYPSVSRRQAERVIELVEN